MQIKYFAISFMGLALAACGGEPTGASQTTVGAPIEIASETNPSSTIELVLDSYECELQRGVRAISYNDGSSGREGVGAPAGWDYCSFDLTVTNTGNTPTMLFPWPSNVIDDEQTIAPGDDSMINMYSTSVALKSATELNPGTTIEYRIYRSYPSGTSPDAVEILADEFSLHEAVAVIQLD